MTTTLSQLSLKHQTDLLERCIYESLDLNEELQREGLDYEMLRYRLNTIIEKQDVSLFNIMTYPLPYQTPEDFDFAVHGIPSVSFFSGAGGLDIGFHYAGFAHIASVEHNALFCETLRYNRPTWTIIGPPKQSGDARHHEDIATELRKTGVSAPFEGVFHGGPPCQPFSIASNQRFSKNGNNFKRIGFANEEHGGLLFDFVWFIKEFQPRVFLIENVAGLLSVGEGDELTQALTMLREAGYTFTQPKIFNAADYGVPQSRQRVFIVGVRGSGNQFVFPAKEPAMVPCGAAFERPLDGIANHLTRQHKAESVLRYMELGFGQRDALGRVDRLDPQRVSKTVIAGGVKGGGRSHLHPFIPRTISVREAARLQTFPDSYVFVGPVARQFTQVGNAVPPLLGMKLARAIFETFYD
jgi:DNA (cytosine-5)-methyltransferase 1